MKRRLTAMAVATVLLLLSAALDAQWLKYPTPGIPRLPDGRPDLVSSAYPMRILTVPGRVVVLYEAIHGWREIFSDGRPHPPDMNPTWMGYSIGHREGDDFVVETAGFNDKGWLDNENNRYFEIVPKR